jgi:hypothetical protein
MVNMGTFPFKEKSGWQNRESNPGPHEEYSETLTTRPRDWSYCVKIKVKVNVKFILLEVTMFQKGRIDTFLLFP